MANHNCESCKFRAKYDDSPRSLLGRLWRWHANWCPGWRRYMASLPAPEKLKLVQRYGLSKAKFGA